MNLYLITRTDDGGGYDTYDSAVVAAESEEKAVLTHPDGSEKWDGSDTGFGTWVKYENVHAELIGQAIPGTDAGVICASFNAG